MKKPNVKEIISDIYNSAGLLSHAPTVSNEKNTRNDTKDSQVYIEVYQQKKPDLLGSHQSLEVLNNNHDKDIIVKSERELLSQIEDYKQIIGRYKKTIRAMHDMNQQLDSEVKKHIEQYKVVEQYKAEIAALQEKITSHNNVVAELKHQISLMNISLESKDKRIIELHVSNSKYEDIIKENTTKMHGLQEQLDSTSASFNNVQASLTDMKKLFSSKCEECVNLNNNLIATSCSNNELKSNMDLLKGKYDEVQSQLEQKNLKIIDLNVMISELTKNKDQEKHMETTASAQELDAYKLMFEEAMRQKEEKEETIQQLTADIEALKKMLPE